MRTRPTTTAALSIAGGLAALLTLTGCGGDSSAEATVESTAAAAPSGAPDITAYRDCMAENGVTLPDMGAPPTAMPSAESSAMPPGGPGAFAGGLPDGVDQATFDAAQAACADLAPVAGPEVPAVPSRSTSQPWPHSGPASRTTASRWPTVRIRCATSTAAIPRSRPRSTPARRCCPCPPRGRAAEVSAQGATARLAARQRGCCAPATRDRSA